jgi:hypothetical protein
MDGHFVRGLAFAAEWERRCAALGSISGDYPITSCMIGAELRQQGDKPYEGQLKSSGSYHEGF